MATVVLEDTVGEQPQVSRLQAEITFSSDMLTCHAKGQSFCFVNEKPRTTCHGVGDNFLSR